MMQVVKEWVETRLTKERSTTDEALQQSKTESEQKVQREGREEREGERGERKWEGGVLR